MSDMEIRVFKYVELGSWDKVAREIEEHDSMHYDKPATGAVYAVGMLAYLVCGDLNSARFLYKRLSQSLQRDVDVTAVWKIVKALWNEEMPAAHEALAKHPWAGSFTTLVVALQAEIREKTLTLLRAVYITIPVSEAAQMLCIPREEVIELAKSVNWTHDAATDSFTEPLTRDPSETAKGPQGIEAVNTVVRNALFLEQLAA
eukprot:TRINITY_DN27788_c0_g1_i1.p1 TRINITY_DN27788_c0_g1~~TRINITY_DN27788_c0_g1_i1.p1  ORF type:complete len:202 (+),score=59.78 TRINITY_DN27788_c0_g1_i1:46-651(+)